MKRKDNLLGKERDKVRMYMIMNKDTQRIRKLVKWQDVETNVKAKISLLFSFFRLCKKKSASEGCDCPKGVTVDHDTVPMRFDADLVKGTTFYPFPAPICRRYCTSLDEEEGEGVKGRRGGKARKESKLIELLSVQL